MFIKILTPNHNGKIELTVADLEALIKEAVDKAIVVNKNNPEGIIPITTAAVFCIVSSRILLPPIKLRQKPPDSLMVCQLPPRS